MFHTYETNCLRICIIKLYADAFLVEFINRPICCYGCLFMDASSFDYTDIFELNLFSSIMQ